MDRVNRKIFIIAIKLINRNIPFSINFFTPIFFFLTRPGLISLPVDNWVVGKAE